MNYQFDDSDRSQTSSSMSTKELSCGGQACYKCGACRDWHPTRNGDDVVKRKDASCNCNYMFCHELVRLPEHNGSESYYPLHNLICMCRDNY